MIKNFNWFILGQGDFTRPYWCYWCPRHSKAGRLLFDGRADYFHRDRGYFPGVDYRSKECRRFGGLSFVFWLGFCIDCIFFWRRRWGCCSWSRPSRPHVFDCAIWIVWEHFSNPWQEWNRRTPWSVLGYKIEVYEIIFKNLTLTNWLTNIKFIV